MIEELILQVPISLFIVFIASYLLLEGVVLMLANMDNMGKYNCFASIIRIVLSVILMAIAFLIHTP